MVRTLLLACGVLASLLYGAMIAAVRFDGYSPISQTVSELSAIRAPTRPLWMLLGSVYDVLVIAFGVGVWMSACKPRPASRRRRAGRIRTARLDVAVCLDASARGAGGGRGTPSDTLHVALGMVTVLFMLVAIGTGAAAFGRRFRFYSIATILVLLVFGALTALDQPRIAANLPTPWVGVWERVDISAFLLWALVLAIALLRVQRAAGTDTRREARRGACASGWDPPVEPERRSKESCPRPRQTA